jgi:hypothetical protein
MAEAWGMASRGNPRGARAVLDAWIDAQGASARRRAERVHARLCTWPDPCDRLLISRRLIELELADGRLPEARRIAAECVSLDPAFEPRPEQLPQTLEELPPRSEIGHGSR